MIGIAHCLWFDSQAEEAARRYVAIFAGKLGRITRYGAEGFEIHQRPAGTVMSVEWEILGQKYVGINGGPIFPQTEAYSIQVLVDTQEEIDRCWRELLADGGQPSHCGWLKDRFGVSWQVTPRVLAEMLEDKDAKRVARVTKAFLAMEKFDIAALKRAFA